MLAFEHCATRRRNMFTFSNTLGINNVLQTISVVKHFQHVDSQNFNVALQFLIHPIIIRCFVTIAIFSDIIILQIKDNAARR